MGAPAIQRRRGPGPRRRRCGSACGIGGCFKPRGRRRGPRGRRPRWRHARGGPVRRGPGGRAVTARRPPGALRSRRASRAAVNSTTVVSQASRVADNRGDNPRSDRCGSLGHHFARVWPRYPTDIRRPDHQHVQPDDDNEAHAEAEDHQPNVANRGRGEQRQPENHDPVTVSRPKHQLSRFRPGRARTAVISPNRLSEAALKGCRTGVGGSEWVVFCWLPWPASA